MAAPRVWFGRILSVAVVAAVFIGVLPRLVDFGEVWEIMSARVGLVEGLVLGSITVASLLASFAAITAALPGLRMREAAEVNVVTTAVAYSVPAGGAAGTALTAAMLRRLGFSAAEITRTIVTTGIWYLAWRLVLPVVALVLLTMGADIGTEARVASVVGLASVLVLAGIVAGGIWWDRPGRRVAATVARVVNRVRGWAKRPAITDLPARFARFRHETSDLIADRWVPLTIATLGYNLALFGVFAAALEIVGARGVGLVEQFAVFVIARQVTALPITPGSVGVLELALIAGLGLFGADTTASTAGVLVFRFFTYLLYLPLGIPVWISWRARLREKETDPGVPQTTTPSHPTTLRHAGDLIRAVGGLAVVAIFIALTRGPVGALEENLFRLINDLPDAILTPVWVVMQAGMLAAIPVAVVIALILRRRRLALDLGMAGMAAWILAKVVKALAGRPRPGALLSDVILRADAAVTEIGFVTGHAAVTAAMATVATIHTRRPVRRLMWALVAAVGFGRIYVGAHLPWDIVGGAALGWTIGSVVRLLRGTPAHLPTATMVRATLERLGLAVTDVSPLPGDLRRAVPFAVETGGGRRLFVKVIGRDQRDADLLRRLWRFLAYREPTAEPPFATPNRQLEHEGLILLLAHDAGVNVPEINSTARVEPGMWLLAMQRVEGDTLESLDPAAVDDGVLDAIWTEAIRLRAAGIAHRDLRAANVIIDPEGRLWVLGFGSAAADAPQHLLDGDVVQLLVMSASIVGPERAVLAASRHLTGPELLRASARVHALGVPGSLRQPAHRYAREIARGIAALTDSPGVEKEHLLRISAWPKLVIGAAATAFAVLLVLGGTVDPGGIWRALAGIDLWWVLIALLAYAATQIGAGLSIIGAAERPLPLGRTVGIQVASGAVGMVSPPAHGSLAANARYLRIVGLTSTEADTVMAATRLAAMAVHGIALVVAIVAMALSDVPDPIRSLWVQPTLFAAVVVVAGVILWGPVHRQALRPIVRSFGSAWRVLARPGRGAMVWIGSAIVTGGSLGAFLAASKAVGLSWDGQASVAAFLLVAALAPLSPLPGGLGVFEAGLVASALGTGAEPAAAAVAAMLVFRVITFWLPLASGLAVSRWLPFETHVDMPASRPDEIPGLRRVARGVPVTLEPMAHPSDLVRAITGIAVGLGLALFAADGFLLPVEVGTFRLVNQLPDWLFAPVEVVMQLGALGIVPVVVALGLVWRRRRLAVDLAIAGPAAWLVARVVKSVADRGRPNELLAEVVIRGDAAGGLGFLSGHAAVAACLATVAAGNIRRPFRWLLLTGVAGVALGRVYVGAHFPLDVVAGAAVGWAIGSVIRLVRGTPAFAPTTGAVIAGLQRMGLEVEHVAPLDTDARGSIPCVASLRGGRDLIVKALSGDQRDADLLFRLWRFMAFGDPEPPFPTPKRQIEHEAYLLLLADRAGARVPAIRAAGSVGEGVWVLAEDRIDGDSLAGAADLEEGTLRGLWEQVGILRAARIAHRDLRLANVVLDRGGTLWLIDFGFGECGVSDQVLAQDVAELLVATACRVGAPRAVAAAVDSLGAGVLDGVGDLLQPLALSAATRTEARQYGGILEEVRLAVATVTGEEGGLASTPLARSPLRVPILLLGALAGYVALASLAGRTATLDAARGVSLRWVGVAVVAVAVGRLATGAVVGILARRWAGFGHALRATATGRGRVVAEYLGQSGLRQETAHAATTAMWVLMGLVHAIALVLAVAATLVENSRPGTMGGKWAIVAGVAALIAAIGLARRIRRSRPLRGELRAASGVLASLVRRHTAGVAAVTLSAVAVSARVLGFLAVAHAVGTGVPVGAQATAVLAVAAIAAFGPLPGGIGVLEPGLVAGLVLGGADPAAAVAAVIIYAILAIWLPLSLAAATHGRIAEVVPPWPAQDSPAAAESPDLVERR